MLALALPAKHHMHSTEYSLQSCDLLQSSYTTKQQHTIQHKLCKRYILTTESQAKGGRTLDLVLQGFWTADALRISCAP